MFAKAVEQGECRSGEQQLAYNAAVAEARGKYHPA